ncbi:MAG: saccharopine dehydrogenase NADP-binding domain-containing protein [Candidatus Eisenbacteria bacterium]|nr:saccharopine dehydrogenase NADP-binding domain-containing protein [Candidatus Eisenbacteria bacterium]
MQKILVIGAGMVGRAMAVDLCRAFDTTLADIDEERLALIREHHPIRVVALNAADQEAVRRAAAGQDLVIGAVPGFLGFETVRAVIEAGRNIVDISFFDEDAFALDEMAKEKGVTAVVDCGVAPGMSNVILGHHAARMEVEDFECVVGGLPVKRTWPYQYKAPFSPIDVFEEYIRPARLVENGRVVTRPVLSGAEYVDIDPVGTLEASNTDGLRTLLRTMKVPNMREKTLRYPGHFEYIRLLLESGFFDKEPIDVNGATVRPIDVTARLLFPRWRLAEDEPELTVMRAILRGRREGKPVEIVYDLFDRYDEETRTSSMARTTGYTATAAATLLLDGSFDRKGICPPEYLGAEPGCFERLLAYQKERGVIYERTERLLPED